MGIQNILFILVFAFAVVLFTKNVRKVIRNIRLGMPLDRTDRKAERWKLMLKVALGQSKMVVRPIPAILHLFVYVGFVIINIEILEIIIDGFFGTHRVFAPLLGSFYNFLIGSFEVLALLVLVGVVAFFARRNFIYIKRFRQKDLDGWPKSDANIILITEVFLMSAFLVMNSTDAILQTRMVEHYSQAGWFPISNLLVPAFSHLSTEALIMIERGTWWFHILGILAFLNYLVYSKHFHIILAFPNVWYANLEAKGRIRNMPEVANEVKRMMDPSAVVPEPEGAVKFGARDVHDLSWKSLLDAYTCTECGRCTSECPANITGKLLSPRLVMMKTRDRLEEVGRNIDKNKGQFVPDGKSLLHDYISPEELWACTTCNACVQACPVNIDPLSIIIDLRRQLVMEESAPPPALASMFSNMENNGAPWQYGQADRLKWTEE
ncbi:MAG: (Fe-S)-binding protein [Bacteroidia bacterium]|nr:(Fe-S)-binding protein [Bacteroidia bacterium]MCC6767438.1 (Fe-S)-binding protein [Bacteroidia bacterium]